MMPAPSTHNPWSTTETEIALSPLKTFLATSAEHHNCNSQQNSRRNSLASSPATINAGSPDQVQSTARSCSQSHSESNAQSSVAPPSSPSVAPLSPRHAREKPVPDEDSLVYKLMEADRRTQKNRDIALRAKINDLYEEFSAENAILDEYSAIFTKLTRDFDFFKSCKLFQYRPTCERIEERAAVEAAAAAAKGRRELMSAEDKCALVATIKEVKKIAAQLSDNGSSCDKEGDKDDDTAIGSDDGPNDTVQSLYNRLIECNKILRKVNLHDI